MFFKIYFSFLYSKTEFLRKLILIQIYLKVLLFSHCKRRRTTLGSVDLSWLKHTLQRGRRLAHAGLNLMLKLNKQYHSKTIYFKNLQVPPTLLNTPYPLPPTPSCTRLPPATFFTRAHAVLKNKLKLISFLYQVKKPNRHLLTTYIGLFS